MDYTIIKKNTALIKTTGETLRQKRKQPKRKHLGKIINATTATQCHSDKFWGMSFPYKTFTNKSFYNQFRVPSKYLGFDRRHIEQIETNIRKENKFYLMTVLLFSSNIRESLIQLY